MNKQDERRDTIEKERGFSMEIWTWPLIFVVLIISLISLIWTARIAKHQEVQKGTNDKSYSEIVENNPNMLNPIFWMYGVAGIFIGMVMVYYILLYR